MKFFYFFIFKYLGYFIQNIKITSGDVKFFLQGVSYASSIVVTITAEV